jgi:phosphopantothenoylcysteine decarboxylase/phosphopantothenate--cysteine ligase
VNGLAGRHVLLIVGGGIAAYKALELVRMLRRDGCRVTSVLTASGAHFVTPLSLQALTEQRVHTDLWSLTDEHEIGHIQLARSADLVVVAPATADLLARMAAGIADDLATTLLLATTTPILAAPSMNMHMWLHAATEANVATLRARGVRFVGPGHGDMACHEFGPGRLAEPDAIRNAVLAALAIRAPFPAALTGRKAIVTSGPTWESIDPVRYLANRSSGRQGHEIAAALARAGATVTLVHGPVALATPAGVASVAVESAAEMHEAAMEALPADIAVAAAAVADWRPRAASPQKLKKTGADALQTLALEPTPDILAALSAPSARRPDLVIGFAAETEKLLDHAIAKRARKGCDWLLANDVGAGSTVMGGSDNQVTLITEAGTEAWPAMPKQAVAECLVGRIAQHFAGNAPWQN